MRDLAKGLLGTSSYWCVLEDGRESFGMEREEVKENEREIVCFECVLLCFWVLYVSGL